MGGVSKSVSARIIHALHFVGMRNSSQMIIAPYSSGAPSPRFEPREAAANGPSASSIGMARSISAVGGGLSVCMWHYQKIALTRLSSGMPLQWRSMSRSLELMLSMALLVESRAPPSSCGISM